MRGLAAVCTGLLLISCSPDLSVDVTAQILCEDSSQCPDTLVCAPGIGRCVVGSANDDQAPVPTLSIDPPVGRDGTLFLIEITFDEPLGAAPTLQIGSALPESLEADPLSLQPRYPATYIARAGDPTLLELTVAAVDTVGNSDTAVAGQLVLDFTAPMGTLSWVSPGPALANAATPRFQGAVVGASRVLGSELVQPGNQVELVVTHSESLDTSGADPVLRVDGTADLSGLAFGADTPVFVRLRVEDVAGNIGMAETPLATVDVTPPTVTIAPVPPDDAGSLSASITFMSSDVDVVAFECRLNGGTFESCTSPYDVILDGDGDHAVEVRAIDHIGLVGAADQVQWHDERRWQVGRSLEAHDAGYCAIASDGSLWCWGANSRGQGGQGYLGGDLFDPGQVGTDRDWLGLFGHSQNMCGIRSDGGAHTAWCWGVVAGASTYQPVPTLGNDWVALERTGGTKGTRYGLDSDGRLWVWHVLSTDPAELVPAEVIAGSTWTEIAPGSRAIQSDGSLWDVSAPVQIDPGPGFFSAVPGCALQGTPGNASAWCWPGPALKAHTDWLLLRATSTGAVVCGLRAGGALYCLGGLWPEVATPGATSSGPRVTEPDFVLIDAGPFVDVALTNGSICAQRTDGRIACWGAGESGLLAARPALSAPTLVDARTDWSVLATALTATCGIRDDAGRGDLWCWGDAACPLASPVATVTPTQLDPTFDWIDVAPGASSVSALYRDMTGTWLFFCRGMTTMVTSVDGNGDWLDLGRGAGEPDPGSLLCPGNHLCGIRDDGGNRTAWCWGCNNNGEFGNGATPIFPQTTPDQVAPGTAQETGWLEISPGSDHTCGIRDGGSGGEMWCWGDNDVGQLGVGNFTRSTTPARVGAATDWIAVAAGGDAACGLRGSMGEGSLWCWGSGGGLGPVAGYQPVQFGTDTDWSTVRLGLNFGCVTKATGALYCWGENAWSQLSDAVSPMGATMPTAITIVGTVSDLGTGAGHTCVVTTSGVQCWGANPLGQAGSGRPWGMYESSKPSR